ncbi:alcohol dehydrogenase [Hydrogenispora ethanolica]|uniref:Alcohol dehydrogenase n=1 Tax=Hydrogenispora ethanolica TaxID=1082276 RepID=A0A4V2QGS7_HYDET|nr:iron-containing alcohol dehydrogenase [Hydrogenispora ethanolica]TCL76977.1 alcohol dehydrogenase [Hydrogenispora ethanolica]
MELRARAAQLLKEFKGDDYRFGLHILEQVGELAAGFGKTALVIANQRFLKPVADRVVASLEQHHVTLAGGKIVPDAGPNCPREDVYRIESYILHYRPDCLIVLGGGSSIDAAKAANVLASLGEFSPEIDSYFGTGLVSEALRRTGKRLYPLIAVETAASSGAHLTKYSNVTDPVAGQKKLIVDPAIIPAKAVFDYAVTETMPVGLTIDGALDGIAHCLEVFFGAAPEKFDAIQEVACLGIELVVRYAKRVMENPHDLEAREALGLATDLGGYAIMIGGTNGAHLTSFSLVDIASHGRACGIMNPYYAVFFAPVVERQLRLVGGIFQRAGFIAAALDSLHGRELGIAVAEGMVAFSRSIQSPTRLSELPGFSDEHIRRALAAAKDPQLEMKLKNMPVALDATLVDEYMEPILTAAKSGDFSLIKNLA